jgi:hypothetical protein
MKTMNLNYETATRESIVAAATEATNAQHVTIVTADKNLDKSFYTVKAELKNNHWAVTDNSTIAAASFVKDANKKANLPDELYNAKDIIAKVIAEVLENTESEDDVVLTF